MPKPCSKLNSTAGAEDIFPQPPRDRAVEDGNITRATLNRSTSTNYVSGVVPRHPTLPGMITGRDYVTGVAQPSGSGMRRVMPGTS